MKDRTVGRIAEYASQLAYNGLSGLAIRGAKRSLVDSFGCALGAYSEAPAQIGRRIASRVQSTPSATLLGTRVRTSPDLAAFVNGTMIRCLDYNDDYLNRDGPHPSDNVSALLAAAESVRSDGKSLVTAMVLTYEIVCQLVDHADFQAHGWDYTTETALGSALGAAKLFGLTSERMQEAMSLAIAPNVALLQTRIGELSMWKSCAGPNAARNGLFAAMLAAEGLTGPVDVIEGQAGLWKQVTGKFELPTLGGGDVPFKIEGTFFKSKPVMYMAMLPIEVMLELRKEVDAHDVKSIDIHLDHFSFKATNSPAKWDPMSKETADHSIQYLVVAALIDGEINEETYAPAKYRSPFALDLLKGVRIHEEAAYTAQWPKTFNCLIRVETHSGRKLEMHRVNPHGHPARPMSDDDISRKFMSLVKPVLPPAKAAAVLDLLWNVERVPDVSRIVDALII